MHIKALLVRKHGSVKPNEASIPEGNEYEVGLDKNFGFSKQLSAKYELGEEVGRRHFGYTCSAKVKKGELKGQEIAIKVISKSKALMKTSTDAMKDSPVLEYVNLLTSLHQIKLGVRLADIYLPQTPHKAGALFTSVHQLEGLESWEQNAQGAYEFFEKNGNRQIVIEELASELGLSPSIPIHVVLQHWIRQSDGKLSFLGFARLLHDMPARSTRKL